MAAAVFILLGIGFLIMLIGNIMFLVAGFRMHVGWGLALLFLPFAGLLFLILHWDEAKRPFLIGLLGFLLSGMGWALGITQGVTAGGSGGAPPAMAKALQMQMQAQKMRQAQNRPHAVRSSGGGSAPAAPARAEGEYVGMTLVKIKEKLGEPDAKMSYGGLTTYTYYDAGVELVSRDGVMVSTQRPAIAHGR